MRKLKLQVQMTVDGYIAGPNGEMDWMVWDWDEALKQYVTELTEPVDCIVLGRRLAQGVGRLHDVQEAGQAPDPFDEGLIAGAQ